MNLDHPLWLIMLIPVTFVVAGAVWKSAAGLSRRRLLLSSVMRWSMLSLVVLALAGPRWLNTSDRKHLWLLVDESASISPGSREKTAAIIRDIETTLPRGDSVEILKFAVEAIVEKPSPDEPNIEGSDLSGAIRRAHAQSLSDRFLHVVLLSDGNATTDGAPHASASVAGRGGRVDAIVLENKDRPEVVLEEIISPAELRKNEPYRVSAQLWSLHETSARLRLFQNHALVETMDARLQPGETVAQFSSSLSPSGADQLRIEVDAEADTFQMNNILQKSVPASGTTRVLLIGSPQEHAALIEILSNGGFEVAVRPPDGIPRSPDEMQSLDMLIVADADAASFGEQRMRLVTEWVRNQGGGLLMLGGENSFGAGGYFRTPVEELLPVSMEHRDREEAAGVALLVVLDRSGSMSMPAGNGQPKMSLANQGAQLAFEVLQPGDQFGVFAVDTTVHTTVPLGPVMGHSEISRRIQGINSAGGGIYIYSALDAAFQALRDTRARIKHVILFADAADAEEKIAGEMSGRISGSTAVELVTAMRAAGITSSVVALGEETDKDTLFLQQIAERGGGKFYLTNEPLSLPRIFTTETMRVTRSSIIEEPFEIRAAEGSGARLEDAPMLLGYNQVRLKPGAQAALATEFGDPLFVQWQAGLGKAAAFTSDAKNRWAAPWIGQPGFGRFWLETVRQLARKDGIFPTHIAVSRQGDEAVVRMEIHSPEGRFVNDLEPVLLASNTSGQRVEDVFEQVAPGLYETRLKIDSARETWLLSVDRSLPNTPPLVRSFSIDYPQEYRRMIPDVEAMQLIAEAGGGRINPSVGDIHAERGGVPVDSSLRPWLLLCAALLLPVEIGIRRFGR